MFNEGHFKLNIEESKQMEQKIKETKKVKVEKEKEKKTKVI
jgi:hypothetical protein